MKKKLTTILLLTLIILTGKVDAATLTQKLGNSAINAEIISGQEVTLRFINKTNYTFSSWTVESGGVTIDTTNPVVTFTMPNNAVVIRANYAEETAVTKYTLTLQNNGITSSIIEYETGTVVDITAGVEDGYIWDGWYYGDGTLYSTNQTTTVTVNSNITLNAVSTNIDPATLLVNNVSVGDYITYTPSNTSYTVTASASRYTSDQTYNPSATTSWRVLSNDGENVEIISTDSVGDLYLQGSTGYINAVQTLNDMASAFVNSTYATSGRSLGYYDVTRYTSESNSGSAMTETELANYKTIDTSTYPIKYGVSSSFPYEDYQYTPDRATLAKHGSMYHSSGYVWLASRYVDTNDFSGYLQFLVRGMYTSGGVYYSHCLYDVYGYGNANTYMYSHGNGVRPVVSLKSTITVTGGTGTSSDPYTIK